MIKLELNGDKKLKTASMHDIFVGENNFDNIHIQLVANEISEHDVSDCEFTAHIVFPDQTYIEYELEFTESEAEIPVNRDLTSTEQILKLFIEIGADNNVIGTTNIVELKVKHLVNEALRIVSRDELIDIIANILTAKLDDVDGVIKTSHIDDKAVTSGKIGDREVKQINLANSSVTGAAINNGAVTNAKLADNAVELRNIASSARTDIPVHGSSKFLTAGGAADYLALKLGLDNDTETLVTLSMLGDPPYRDPTKDYYIALAEDVLPLGNPSGFRVRLINVNTVQYIFDDGCNIWARKEITSTHWSTFKLISVV